MPLDLVMNGQSRTFDSLGQAATVEELVATLGLKADRVAVEHNGQIVPRSTWSGTRLTNGDRLELVHFVGGGSQPW